MTRLEFQVLVAHPGIQYAHELATALELTGHLARFLSAVPVRDSLSKSRSVWFGHHLRSVPIPRAKRSHMLPVALLRKTLACPPLRVFGDSGHKRLDQIHDIWVASQLARIKPNLVVCYESSALHTFRVARRAGVTCVLDAASVHHRFANTYLAELGVGVDAGHDRYKDKEIELADAVICLSEFAANTYIEAGVPKEKIYAVPLGTHLPMNRTSHPRGDSPQLRFVFVGSLLRRKGLDILLDVFEQLLQENVPVELTLIGGVAEPDLLHRARRLGNVKHIPFMPQEALFREVAMHDCLILPSRFDSFGMVVAEAMAVGVPAIVSDRVGAKCIIEDHPKAGWIVSLESTKLKSQIMSLVHDKASLVEARTAAVNAAADYSWDAYRRRVVVTLETIYMSSVKCKK